MPRVEKKILLFFNLKHCHFLFSEVLPEMESQAEYDGQNFSFTTPDSMDNGGSQNLTKLTTANMDDMEEYYNFGKDTSSYTTPWVGVDQRTRFGFLYTDVVMDFFGSFHLFFGLLPEEPEARDSDGRPGRRCTSEGTSQILKLLTRPGAPFLGLLCLQTQRLLAEDSQACMLCVHIGYLK